MGKDVFGQERHECTVAGCDCKSYYCVIDAMTDEERAMTVVHHPRNHPGYVTCTCGHTVGQHATDETVPAPPAASGELRKCETCNKRAGACLSPGEEGHLKWREAYCPKCFTKPNAKGCKLLDRDGPWTIAAAATAMAESICFPIFLILTWRLGIKWILVLLSFVFLLSLGIAQWGAYNKPSATFFLLPTRGWELLVGVFAAFYLKYNTHLKSHTLNQVFSMLGFGMIVYSIML